MSKGTSHSNVMDKDDITAFLAAYFPQIREGGTELLVEDAGPMTARLRMVFNERFLRPGGTISGPTMFMLADVGLYVAILAQIGPVALAVTTNLNINFLQKPGHSDLIADCRVLKLGKRLAVGDVSIFSAGNGVLVAHATGTYSIPAH